MNAADLPITKRLPTDTATHTTLRGRWLWAARAAWVVIVVLAVVGIISMIPVYHNTLFEDSRFDAVLTQAGISHEVFAVYMIAISIIQFTVFSVVGLLLFLRRSDDWWAMLVSMVLITFGGYSGSFSVLAVIDQMGVFRPMIHLILGIANAAFVVFLYIFPDGRFAPRWTFWPVALWVVWMLAMGLFPDSPISLYRMPPALSFVIPLIAYGGSVAVQTYRETHYYTPAQKQQTKWIMVGLLLSLLGGFALFMWPPLMFPELLGGGMSALIFQLVSRLVGSLSLMAIPVGIAFSILRYRLWDVDFLINRSLVYGTLTASLVVLFVAGFAIVQLLFTHLQSGMNAGIALAASGVVFGLMFMPARRQLQRFIDQRVYGIKIDYDKTPLPLPPAAGIVTVGTKLGAYQVIGALGRGGMAEVYRGQHSTLGREVAIKTLHVNLAADPDFRKRFEREARTIGQLKHSNIVELYDFGEADSVVYMVMEYISGGDLSIRLAQAGPVSADETRRLITGIAGALDYAHQQGVVHRDIKPSNVMLRQANGDVRPVLTDFGIARIVGGGTRITRTGMIGTFDYIAPEQIRDSSDVDGRADIYSLGIMLFQMLTGRLPFTASNPGALLIAHLNQPAPDPRTIRADIPEDASLAALKAMEKNPDDRFQTAGEFAAALA